MNKINEQQSIYSHRVSILLVLQLHLYKLRLWKWSSSANKQLYR